MLRLKSSVPTGPDPFSAVLQSTRAVAARSEGPFAERDLLAQMRADGIAFTAEDGGPAEAALAEEAELFVAKLALDHLYARRELSRRLGGDGTYLYGRSGG
ncbi:MAG: hypothetical protein ACYDFT_01705 [Thermoplasmata archaeon]